MSIENSQQISDVKVMLVKGIDGEGIESIEQTGTSGLVDTYTITYNDGKKTTFTVTNGKGIVSIAKTATTGTVDTYTITYNDNTTSTFEVTNGTVASAIAYRDTTVEDALDGLTANTLGTAVDITSYNSSNNQYTCLSDGYAQIDTSDTADLSGRLYVDNKLLFLITSYKYIGSIFVKKGMTIYCTNMSASSHARFFPLT